MTVNDNEYICHSVLFSDRRERLLLLLFFVIYLIYYKAK